jgi:hypothetical protein
VHHRLLFSAAVAGHLVDHEPHVALGIGLRTIEHGLHEAVGGTRHLRQFAEQVGLHLRDVALALIDRGLRHAHLTRLHPGEIHDHRCVALELGDRVVVHRALHRRQDDLVERGRHVDVWVRAAQRLLTVDHEARDRGGDRIAREVADEPEDEQHCGHDDDDLECATTHRAAAPGKGRAG